MQKKNLCLSEYFLMVNVCNLLYRNKRALESLTWILAHDEMRCIGLHDWRDTINFKSLLFLSLVAMLFSRAERSFWSEGISNRALWGPFLWNIEFRPVVQEEMPFEDISYIEFWWLLYSAEPNPLCNLGKGHHLRTIPWKYFEFGPVVQEMMFKDILI